MGELSAWIAGITTICVIGVAWGSHSQKISDHGRQLEQKADAEAVRELKTKVEGMDNWTRVHEREAEKYRLDATERFASMQKSIEIGMTNHAELVRIIGRLEAALDKMESKFEGLTVKMEAAIQRRRGNES
jgi:hypothetical protein